MTTTAEFKARFPEFDSIADARVQIFLDDAALVMDSGIWGGIYNLGQAYLAAHYLSLAEKSSAGGSAATAGPVVSRSVDGVSVAYAGTPSAPSNSNAAYYNSTQYGQRYMVLLKNLGVSASVV